MDTPGLRICPKINKNEISTIKSLSSIKSKEVKDVELGCQEFQGKERCPYSWIYNNHT
jgi:hypothetical protein